jgi:hypothetical protein
MKISSGLQASSYLWLGYCVHWIAFSKLGFWESFFIVCGGLILIWLFFGVLYLIKGIIDGKIKLEDKG